MKTGEPSSCLNCGAFSRANEKGDGLELCNNPNDMMNGMGGGIFDSLFGGMPDMGGMGDNMGDMGGADVFASTPEKTNPKEKANNAKQQGTIIDVDVERD